MYFSTVCITFSCYVSVLQRLLSFILCIKAIKQLHKRPIRFVGRSRIFFFLKEGVQPLMTIFLSFGPEMRLQP